MDYKLQLHEFFIEGGNREKSHVILHITEPSTAEEKKRGYFFAACDLNNASTKHIVDFQNIVDEIEKNYYDSSNKIATLETILKEINRANFHLLKETVAVNCVVGTIVDQEIEFAFCGQPHLLLFYKTKTDLYKTMDLIEQNVETASEQLFGQLVQGRLSVNDFVFIGTPNVKDFFTDDRLQKIVTSRPARQSAEHIGRVLSDIRDGQSFGGLIIHLQHINNTEQIKKPKPKYTLGSERSLQNLFSTEKNTADTLAPSFVPQINEHLQNIWQEKNEQTQQSKHQSPTAEISSSHLRQYKPLKTNSKPTGQMLKNVSDGLMKFLKSATQFIWIIILFIFSSLASIGRFLGMLFFFITNMHDRRRQIMDNWRKQIKIRKEYLKNMPLITKILFFSAIGVGLAIIASIYLIGAQQKKAAAEKIAQSTIREIIAHKDAAESALIYKDENAALNEATAAKQLQTSLDCKIYTRECKQFDEQIETILSQIRKINLVTPELLADWSQNFNSSDTRLVRFNNQIIAFSPTKTTLFSYDLLTKTTKEINSNFLGLAAAAVPKENDYLIFVYDNNKLVKYDSKNNILLKAEISFPNDNAKITDMLIYNRRLYSLDVANNQIYKHNGTKTGFENGQPWIKDSSVDLRAATSLATDGDMFIGTNNGKIEKYTKGENQPFTVNGLDPALNSNAEIWTYTDKLYLYILDSVGKRLIVLEKSGQLKEQLTAKEWRAPSGMVIDEDNNTGFILDSGKLYKINL